jgi:hypothetical protein
MSVFKRNPLSGAQNTESVSIYRSVPINETILILDIFCRPVFYLERKVSEPKTETSCVDISQLNIYHLKSETESNLRNVFFQIRDKSTDRIVIPIRQRVF